MACTMCQITPADINCQFSLDDALENIRKHYKLIETKLTQKSKQVDELKERNDKLMRAVDCLKNPNTLARLHSQPDQSDTHMQSFLRTPLLASPIFEDITIIDDEEEDKKLVSVMDTALCGSDLNTTINNDVITETENPAKREPHIRRLALKQRSKVPPNKKLENNEKKNPTTSPLPQPSVEPTKLPAKQGDDISKQKANRSNLRRLALKQTRLPFDEKRERSPKTGTPTRTLTLGRFNKQRETRAELEDDVFDFNKSVTFQFKSPTQKKSKMDDTKIDLFSSPKSSDASLMIVPSPTQTICFLDDTTDEELTEQRNVQPREDGNNKEVDKENADSHTPPPTDKTINTTRRRISPTRRIKKEPITQQITKKAANPIFKESDTAEEESDDDFIVRPMQIKIEPMSKKQIDIDSIDCAECRNYIKFFGERMTTEKLEEQIRNCLSHNKQNALRAETPDGFWNPLLVSFDADDPRNEVLVDKRFEHK